MTIRDIAKKIDKSRENEDYVVLERVAESLEINNFYYYGDEQKRLRAYWIGYWLCTDSWVGWRMYFFDGQFVAISEQKGRKCSEDFEWVSRDAAEKVRRFLLDLISADELGVDLCNLDEDLGDSYKIAFPNQVLNWDKARYKGQPIELVRKEPRPSISTSILIKTRDTQEEYLVDLVELDFPIHVIENDEPCSAKEEPSQRAAETKSLAAYNTHLANCDWVVEKAKELKALMSYESDSMLAANRTRALSGIDTMLATLNELRAYVADADNTKGENKKC